MDLGVSLFVKGTCIRWINYTCHYTITAPCYSDSLFSVVGHKGLLIALDHTFKYLAVHKHMRCLVNLCIFQCTKPCVGLVHSPLLWCQQGTARDATAVVIFCVGLELKKLQNPHLLTKQWQHWILGCYHCALLYSHFSHWTATRPLL